jgi:hypothetical protein
MSNDTISLTLKGGKTWELSKAVQIGIMPDPKGTKMFMVLPYRILVKETPQEIIDKFKSS